MKRAICFFLLCPTLLFCQSARHDSSYGPSKTTMIRDLAVFGNRKLSTNKILAALDTKKGAAFAADIFLDDLKKILHLYSAQHFYLIGIDSVKKTFSSDSSQLSIFIYLTENKPLDIGSLQITGCQTFTAAALRNAMNSTEGKMFDPDLLEEDMDHLLHLYDNSGFPFAKITVNEMILYDDHTQPKIAMRLNVEENQFALIRKIDVAGNIETQERIVTREFRMPLPHAYDQSRIDAGLDRIRKLPFMDDAQLTDVIPLSDSAYGLKIAIREGPSNTIDGVAGYVPSRPNSTEKGYFTGLANLSFQNLFGTARHLEVHWQKKNRFSQDLLIAYTEPWVLDYPVSLGVSLQQLVQDTIYTLRQFTLDGAVLMGTHWQGLFGGKLKSVTPTDDVTGFLSNIPTADFISAYVGVSYDTRDDRINPRKGLFYKASLEYGRKNESSFSENSGGTDTLFVYNSTVIVDRVHQKLNTEKVMMDFEMAVPLSRKLIFFDAVHAAVYKTPQTVVPYSEQFLFGGLKSVRGYTQDFFNGTRVGWNNLELRWLTSRRSRLFVFMDTGYYFRNAVENSKIVRQQDWPIGYGFGLRFQTKLGLFGLDYGLGKGDTFATGKVHFGITSQF